MSVAGLQKQLHKANNGYRAHFMEALLSTEATWQPIIDLLSMPVNSNGAIEEHNFATQSPRFSEWVGDRQMSALGVGGWTLKNRNYEGSVWIDRNDLEDDKLGLYTAQIRQLAQNGVLHQFDLIRDLLNANFSTTSYDGVAFFSNSHPLQDSASLNDNLTTGVLSNDAYRAACVLLREMKDSRGEYLNLNCTHLICGNDNEWVAREILKQNVLATGESNVAMGTAQVLIVPGLTSTNWMVADLGKMLKPFVLQKRRPLEFISVTDADSPEVFQRRKFMYGADYRGAVGNAFYQLMVGSVG